jgi:hypothetical protein
MTDPTAGLSLTQTRIASGVWEGVLAGVVGDVPAVQALHGDRALDGVEVTPLPGKSGRHAVRVPIPAQILTEGVQTVLMQVGDTVLAQFSLIAGAQPDDDLRAEISLLRAELDLLKRAFRRHCAETQS